MSAYQMLPDGNVRRMSDGACIPTNLLNRDYLEFLTWKSIGNVPDPVDPIYAAYDAQSASDATSRAAVKADATVAMLASKTPAQIDAYVVANVTDLASAKLLLRALAQVCGVLAKGM